MFWNSFKYIGLTITSLNHVSSSLNLLWDDKIHDFFFISSVLHAKKVSINVYKVGNSKSRTEEVTLLGKRLPCNHEDLRSISSAHVKARGGGMACVCNSSWTGKDRRIPGTAQPDSIAKQTSKLQFPWEALPPAPSLKKKMEGNRGKYMMLNSDLHMHAHTCAQDSHTWTSAPTHTDSCGKIA